MRRPMLGRGEELRPMLGREERLRPKFKATEEELRPMIGRVDDLRPKLGREKVRSPIATVAEVVAVDSSAS